MGICLGCGAKLDDGAKYCSECGREVSAQDIQQKETTSEDAIQSMEQFIHVISSQDTHQNSSTFEKPVQSVEHSTQSVTSDVESVSQEGTRQKESTFDNKVQSVENSIRFFTSNVMDKAQAAVDTLKTANDGVRQQTEEKRSQSRNVILSDGEKIVRSYFCIRLLGGKGDGYLTVTNKRVLFESRGNDSLITQEVWLEGITGITAFSGKEMIIPGFLLGLFVCLLSLPLLIASVGLALSFLVIGVVIIFVCWRTCFKLDIRGNFNSSGISLGTSQAPLFGNRPQGILSGRPTEETDRMLNELGAMIKDLQTMGDLAIEKWR